MTTELDRLPSPGPGCPHCGKALPPPAAGPGRPARTRPRTVLAVVALVVSVVYLLNFTLGIVELPDNLPVIGNMDEAAATWLLLAALSYFGFDPLPFRRR